MEVNMLVLSRRESERIKLGNSIVLTVIRVSGDRVRLGIEARRTCWYYARNYRSSLPTLYSAYRNIRCTVFVGKYKVFL